MTPAIVGALDGGGNLASREFLMRNRCAAHGRETS
jgi:hypothetical protein